MIALLLNPAYSQLVAKKNATEFCSSKIQGGHTAPSGFFTSVYPGTPSMVGLGRDVFGHAGGLVCRSANLIQHRHPHFAVRRGLTAIQGASMSKSPRTPESTQTPETPKQCGPHHQPFSWIWKKEPNHRAEFVALTYDVSRGIETVLDVVMNAQLHEQSHGYDGDDPEDRPLFSRADTERLVRLALASAKMLGDEADNLIDRANRAADKDGGGLP